MAEASGEGRQGREGERGGMRLPGGGALWNFKAPQWRTAAVLGGLLVVGVILLTAHAAPPAKPVAAVAAGGVSDGNSATAADPLAAQEAALDAQLAGSLGRIAGAGRVTVSVRLSGGARTDYAVNDQQTNSTTGDTVSGGQNQTSTQSSVNRQLVLTPSGAPVVSATTAPTVAGVLVLATGATDGTVRRELAQAAQTLTGVPLYQVTVLPAAEGGSGVGVGAA